MLEIPIWRAGRERQSLDLRVLRDYRGADLARVAAVPALLVHRVVAELRAAVDAGRASTSDLPALWDAISEAGRLLDAAELGGCSPEAHARLVTLATGAPMSDSRRALSELASGMVHIKDALHWQSPSGGLEPFLTHRLALGGGRSCGWVPVGQVLGFVAPSNHPAVHLTWVLALAMGWAVAVRPGADDPLTPWRVLLALREAGFPVERIALLPGEHDLVPALVAHCDRTVAYGGTALERLIGHGRRVLFNGPGRSKVLVDADAAHGRAGDAARERADTVAPVETQSPPPQALLDFLLDCVLHDGGRKCTCASGIVVRGEVPGLLDALSDRLRNLPLLDPLDPAALVPAWKSAEALRQTPAELVQVDGVSFARPALRVCSSAADPLFGAELPAPWASAVQIGEAVDPMPILQGSLAVTLLSRDAGLARRCLLDTSIQKLFVGPIPPWHTEPGAPHHGRLADFLFTAKAFREADISWT